MSHWLRLAGFCCLLGLGTSIAAGADSVAPASPGLDRMPGLELWLDAARVAGPGEPGSGKQSPGESGLVGQWNDLSPHKRHARQPDAGKQPKRVKAGDGWVIRFDGDDDHLRILELNQKLTAFTVFVVAAPHSNPGYFRGLFAFNQSNRRDYETGFTLDLSALFSARLDNINLEGRGFGGARNLLATPGPFGKLHQFECVADPQTRRVRLAVDGKPQLDREYTPAELIMDEITVGARFYTNEPGQPQQVRGFFPGDVTELLVFNRVLTDEETRQVRTYLDQKHAALRDALPATLNLRGGPNSELLATVADPPPVQMLVPGFSAFELPVELANINNVRYRADGQLVALGYSGDVWLLRDADGDGLEDTAQKFFDSKGSLRSPIGLALIPAGHALLKPGSETDRGIVVPSKGKVSAILDHDGDGAADEERVIASGWKEISHNVDALGAAIGPDGSIYFGLATPQFENAYQIDKDGKGHFDINSERGTVQRIVPDLSRRETVCTGVRFSVGMAVNDQVSGTDGQGDLFITDQEGATWLSNGNPLDELLHIRSGRHYGFPPQHPRHLPDVADMPSTFDYGPQHQSTCGLAFNLPRVFSLKAPQWQRQDALFGPAAWKGNAFVTGESRGKLYRTELIPWTRDGQRTYVARNQLIACLGMLAVDCCVSPRGELVVACHSGGPDWGSGPGGQGKLFKIRFTQPQLAQPVAAWAAGPQEVRVAFDRPIDPEHLRNLVSQVRITGGAYVAPGDRFETLWPGYAVVQMQKSSPRYNLAVHGISVLPDRRTLVITTAPHSIAWQYALTLPGLGRVDAKAPAGKSDPAASRPAALPQHPQVDLAYSLNGVAARWEPADRSRPGWSGWLPHIDLQVASGLSTGIADDDPFWEAIRQPGTLFVETKLDLRDLAHPAVQPGSKLDHQWPAEEIRIVLDASGPLSLTADDKPQAQGAAHGDRQVVSYTVSSARTEPLRLRIEMQTGDESPALTASWHCDRLDRGNGQPIPLYRLILPWAETKSSPLDAPPARPPIPELAGGSWGRGRRVFLSDEAGCAKCHVAHPEFGRIGPDLSNLVHRDYASVLRDVTQPSVALNPDFLASIVQLKDGRVLTGAIRSDGDTLLVGDKDAKVHRIARADVDEIAHSAASIMPEGTLKRLGDQATKDLLTYLLVEPPRMPLESPLPPPSPRTRAEVARVLAGGTEVAAAAAGTTAPPLRKLNILLVAGAKDHGPGEHDYPAWKEAWKELLRGAAEVSVETAMEWPTAEQIEVADTIVFFQKGNWNAERARAIDAHLARGRGLIYIHWAVEAGAEAPAFAQRIGLASNAAKLKFRHGPLDLGFETGKDHPIGRNFDKVHFHDESYWQMQGDPASIRVLATGVEDGRAQPLFWTLEPAGGRVFVSIPGHYSWTFDDPLFRILLLRGIAWTANEPVDRLNELATIGVTLAD